MLASDALAEFRRFLSRRRADLARMSPRQAMDAMRSFFMEVEVSDCDPESDGDMLLVQWGAHDWGKGSWFDFDVTRQLILPDGEDGAIWQLHLTLRFPPTAALTALGAGQQWCTSRADILAFATRVADAPAFRAVADSMTEHVEVNWARAD